MAVLRPTRRELFRRAGAAGLLLAPILRARRARAAAAPRFVAMYFPNGVPGNVDALFLPQKTGGAWNWSGRLTGSLQRFERHLMVFHGMRMRPFAKTHTHLSFGNALLTGTDSFVSYEPLNQSLDRHLASKMGTKPLFLSIDRAKERAAVISWEGAGQPQEPEQDPQKAYDQLFSGYMAMCDRGAVPRPARKLFVLDGVVEDLRAAKRTFGLGAEEVQKLQRYEAALAAVEAGLRRLPQDAGSTCKSGRPPTLDFTQKAAIPARTRLQIDVLVAALAFGVSRVATLQLFYGFDEHQYTWAPGAGQGGHHTMTHENVVERDSWLFPIMRWHTEQAAHLLLGLEGIQEADGRSLLDNSVVLWGTDTPNGYTHNIERESAGMMVFGGGAGGLKPNQDIVATERKHVDLLATLCRACGVDGALYEQRANFSRLFTEVLA